MAEIAQRVFLFDGTKNLLRLYKEEFVRPFTAPASWGRLRLALCFAITDTGGSFTSTRFFAGFCTTPDSPFGAANTVRAEGIDIVSGNTFTRNAGSGNPYYTVNFVYGNRRLAGVDNQSGITSTGFGFAATGGTLTRRSFLTLDILASNGYLYIAGSSTTSATTDLSPSNFVEVAETIPPSYLGNAYAQQLSTPGGSTSPTLATANVYWGNGLAPLEIYAMAVYIYPY